MSFFYLVTEEINRGLHAFEFYRTVNNRVMVASVRANSAAEDVSNTKNPMIYLFRCSEEGKQYLYCLSFVFFHENLVLNKVIRVDAPYSKKAADKLFFC